MKGGVLMTLEESLHVTRHLKRHVQELRDGTIEKTKEYLDLLVDTRYKIVELEHEIIYVMRERKFPGYETIDFQVDLSIPETYQNYEFHDFMVDNFLIILKVMAQLEYLKLISPDLTQEEASKQLKILQIAIMDFSVAIELFKTYYNINKDFNNIVI
ncbi:hypothetical protein D3C72_1872990 [compost metagenome]